MDHKPLVVNGNELTIDDVVSVARFGRQVEISSDPTVLERLRGSHHLVQRAVAEGKAIYGVTSGFGGMSQQMIAPAEASELQKNLLCFLKTGIGQRLPAADVCAAMLLRANSLVRGASGIRLEIIERLTIFLNAGVTPHMFDLGSIGASGDLVPLTNIAGALVGLNDSFRVDFQGVTMGAPSALERLKLKPIELAPKEGLALVNGTSALTGIAAGCLYDARSLLAVTLATHSLMLQGLLASNQPFHPFIHDQKPHPGQRFAAARMLELLENSPLIRDEIRGGSRAPRGDRLIQDRYSVRCLPQYLGPIIDGMATAREQVEVEMNAATDNPLIDTEEERFFQGGNFLGQYVSVAMDHFRSYLALLAKHLDVQIALLVEPSFNNGLPGSLVGNPERRVNMGLKGLQITGNSIMPMITHLGHSLADQYPTHAEQFNQNINSLGFGSVRLAQDSVGLFQHYLALALIFGVQAVDLRTYLLKGHYDAGSCLSGMTLALYHAVKEVIGRPADPQRPLIYNDDEQSLDSYQVALLIDLVSGRTLMSALTTLVDQLRQYRPNKNRL